MESQVCLREVIVDIVSFDSLPDYVRFLIVKDDGALDVRVHQKASWRTYNAVLEKHDGESPNGGWCTLCEEQLVIEVH